MNTRVRFTSVMAGALSVLMLAAGAAPMAYAEPMERPEVSLTRTASSAQTLNAQLSRNVYRYVQRAVTETVQVPYEVDVPYQATEEYTDYVQECRNRTEQSCTNRQVCQGGGTRERRVCGTRKVCEGGGTRPRNVCHDREVCRFTPEGKKCTTETKCETIQERIPGTCRDVEECRMVRDEIPPVCRDVSECHPVTRNVCENVPVTRTRTVTRHRSETRYRSEQQTRVVTDQFFVRQYGTKVAIVMPQGAELLRGEEETILVSLSETDSPMSVDVEVESPAYAYRVQSQAASGGTIRVTLEQIAKYGPEDLGRETVTGLSVIESGGRHLIRFEDKGIVSRVETDYSVQLFDRDLNRTVFETRAKGTFGSRQISIPVEAALDKKHDYVIRLSVRREGKVLSAPLEFEVESRANGELDPSEYGDASQIRDIAIEGSRLDSKVVFKDGLAEEDKIETEYELQFARRLRLHWGDWTLFETTWDIPMGKVKLRKSQLTRDAQGRFTVALNGLKAPKKGDLEWNFVPGEDVFVTVIAVRTSERFTDGEPVSVTQKTRVRIR